MFGENLTTEDADPNGALIGERWRIGTDLILEVSSPRIPCGTFQGWLLPRLLVVDALPRELRDLAQRRTA
jgi:MOSC domain-containing protein YiiM